MDLALDTNALSAFLDGDSEVESVLFSAGAIAVPVIVAGEYFYGIGRSRHRSIYEKILGDLLRETIILKIDIDTAREYAAVRDELSRAGKPIPANDLWIAALCRQHAIELLSRDQHFDVVPRLKRRSW